MKFQWFVAIVLLALVVLLIPIACAPQVGQAAPLVQTDTAALFQQRCSPCHGKTGEGTKLAPALTQLDHLTDAQLLEVISEGKSGTAMPAWKTMLSADEMQSLVPYLRSLGGAANPPPAPTAASVPNPVVAPAAEPALHAALALEPGPNGVVVARATVQDANGQPVANVPVTLDLLTALGGRLDIGSAKTDAQGTATIQYQAGLGRSLTLEARAGQGAQAVTTSATAATPGGEAWTPAPLISPNPPGAEVALLVVVLGGVWLTYGVVGRHLLGILREG